MTNAKDHVVITKQQIFEEVYNFISSEEFRVRLEEIAAFVSEKNDYYGDAWQKDGLLTTLVDMKDKLYRTEVIRDKKGIVKGQYVFFPANVDLDDILKDLWIRAIMGWMKWHKMILSQPLTPAIDLHESVIFKSDDPFDGDADG